ncbi:MAG: GIY-YIG nuclease family protein [Candidatus Omnitrophica bacterium]|nr:GIY-YIG nuclease family protein [Candidatus Omnitrophota bacterium]
MEQSPELRKNILRAPNASGVYLMRDCSGQVLYVGKANSLKKRLLNYLGRDLTCKTQMLMAKVADVEFRLTANEAMALLLEFKLIHEFKPRYNVSLKDDKSFPFVRISHEAFPLIQVTRKKNNDAASRYLGPYTNTKLLKSALKIIRLEFAYRSCQRLPKQSCIYHEINLCPAPCIGKISQKEYQQRIANIILILEGKQDLLIRKLTKSMQNKSAAGDFEAAARMRDQIIILSRMAERADAFSYQNALQELKQSLNLKNLPGRIEGFDISNLSGKQATGAMVSFYHGQADKNNYRRFRIKSVQQIDDYKMLAEILRRRYTRLLKEKKALPDLLLIDGGKGHLLTAVRQLAALNLHIPLVSIAKEKENIYSSQPGKLRVALAKDGAAINLIRRIRDEAHRFALSYHHLLRKKEIFK